jgi:outer membrane protein
MNTLNKIILGLFLASFLGATAGAQTKIGTVDLNKIFNGYWKTKEAKNMIDDQRAGFEKDLNKMMDTGNKAADEYKKLLADASDPLLSAEQRDKNKKAAEDKLKGMNDLKEDINRERARDASTLEEQSSRMRNNILDEIRTAINAKAKEAGCSLVIDVSAESAAKTPIVLYTSPDANDLTDKVSEDLNRSHSGTSAPAPSSEKAPAKKN